MSNRVALKNRSLPIYTKGEEIFNMVSHIVGGAWGVAVLIICAVMTVVNKDAVGLLCGSVYRIHPHRRCRRRIPMHKKPGEPRPPGFPYLLFVPFRVTCRNVCPAGAQYFTKNSTVL